MSCWPASSASAALNSSASFSAGAGSVALSGDNSCAGREPASSAAAGGDHACVPACCCGCGCAMSSAAPLSWMSAAESAGLAREDSACTHVIAHPSAWAQKPIACLSMTCGLACIPQAAAVVRNGALSASSARGQEFRSHIDVASFDTSGVPRAVDDSRLRRAGSHSCSSCPYCGGGRSAPSLRRTS